jgi:hypothetical protein
MAERYGTDEGETDARGRPGPETPPALQGYQTGAGEGATYVLTDTCSIDDPQATGRWIKALARDTVEVEP